MANPWELPVEGSSLPKKPWELQEEGTRPTLSWDESPIAVEPKKRRTFIRGEPVETYDNQREISLGEKGLLPDNPGEGALTLKDYQDISYYSAGPEYARTYIGKKVKEKYGSQFSPEELTRIKDGKIQYLDLSLEKPRWREVDTGVLYSFGKPAMWGEALADVGAGAAGVIGGTALTGTPAGGLAGGAALPGVNAYLWRKMALKKGQELGMNELLTDEDIERMSIGYGLQTGGASLGMSALGFLASGPGEKSLFGLGAGGYADDFRRNLSQSDRLVDDVNALRPQSADEAFDPTPAQRGRVKEVKNIEATLEAGHAAKATQEISQELLDRRAKNERVLTGIWDYIFPDKNTSLADLDQLGLNLRASAYAAANQAPDARAARAAATARSKVQSTVDNIDEVLDYDKVLADIRGMESPDGVIAGTKFYDYRDNVVRKQAEKAGEVERRGKNVTVEISRKNLLLDDLLRLRSRLGVGLESLRSALGDETTVRQLDDFLALLENNGGVIPFKDADAIHGQLGRLIAKIEKAGPAGGVNVQGTGPLADMLATIEQAIRTTARTGPVHASDLVQAWDERKTLTTIRHDLFDGRAVRELFNNAEKDGPAGIELANKIFAEQNPRYLSQLMEIAGNDPESLAALRKMFMAKYKDSVRTKDGISLQNHVNFINKHAGHIELLFPDQAGRPWRAIGELEKAALAAEEKAAQLAKIHSRAWEHVFGDKYPYSSTQLVRTLTEGRLNTKQTKDFINHLAQTDPTLLNFVRQEAISSVRAKLGSDGMPTARSIRNFVRSGRGENFFAIMGDQGQSYKNNLTTLADAISLVKTDKGVSKGVPSANLMTSTTRAAFGPLHRIQRFITAGRQVQGWMNAKKTYEVMSDPVRLQRALQYAATAPHIRAVPPAIMADIGALAVIFTEDKED